VLILLGDERPCQRCIKRGLQDQCQDGFRKKAKYLHDAPAEALIPPGLGGTFGFGDKNVARGQTTPNRTPIVQQGYFANTQPMEMYSPAAAQRPTFPGLLASSASSYGNVTTPISPFSISAPPPAQMITTPTMPQGSGSMHQPPHQPHHQLPFDPSDPALFNFNIEGLNFGNRYGALEFNMLQAMSNGVNDGPHDVVTPMSAHPAYSLGGYAQNPALFEQNAMMNANNFHSAPAATGLGHRRPPSISDLRTPHNTPIIKSADAADSSVPYAYAIGVTNKSNSLASASPVSLSQDAPGSIENAASSPRLFAASGENTFPLLHHHDHHHGQHPHHHHQQPVQHPHSSAAADSFLLTSAHTSRKRAHNADQVYNGVRKPYSYHAGWHRLFTHVKNHFSKDNVQRVAQYVSVIRPPLTAFAQYLTANDLILMETTIQRQLYEYRDFIKATGTPTIVTRRDGSILAVSDEFYKMTRWSDGVVLGKERNRNVNRGQGSLGAILSGIRDEDEEGGKGSTGDGQALHISEIFEQQ
jgi:PAS domain-containing protein